MSLSGKSIFISGGSRGIGLEIAKACAKDGAKVAIAAKTAEPHPKLPGTIYSAAEEIEAAGGTALPIICDIRDDASVEAAVGKAADAFGGIDVCVNNASAINLIGTDSLTMKQYDLMHQINGRGSFLVAKTCLPFLKKSDNPHILNLAPPLDMKPRWFKNFPAYTAAKYTMSMWVMGMAAEYEKAGIAVNALWPRTTIATAAVRNMIGGEGMVQGSRVAKIMGDAAYAILSRNSREFTGNFCIDDLVLAEAGVTDFAQYRVSKDGPLFGDFFVPEDIAPSPGGEELTHPPA